MRHLQADLKRGNRVDRNYFVPLLIVMGHGGRIHWRPNLSVCKRKVWNREASVLMAHGRAEDQLRENQERGGGKQPCEYTLDWSARFCSNGFRNWNRSSHEQRRAL